MTTAPFQQRGALRLGLIAVTIVCVVAAFAVAPGAVVAQDDDDGMPPVPAGYYGTVTIDGDPAPEGLEVTAELEGETYGPIETDENGAFGGELINQSKLTVDPDSAPDDPTVTFFVDGEEAAETAEWESGASEEITLTIDTDDDQSTGAGGGGGGGGATDTDDTSDTDADGSDDTSDTDADGSDDTEETPTATDDTDTESEDDTTEDGVPGFGVVSILSALLAVTLSVRLRQLVTE